MIGIFFKLIDNDKCRSPTVTLKVKPNNYNGLLLFKNKQQTLPEASAGEAECYWERAT